MSLSGASARAQKSQRWAEFRWLWLVVNGWLVISGIPFLMPRNFQVNRKIWVAFGLLAISLRIFTGAPEAQVSFSSLLVDQKIGQAQDLNHLNGHKNVDVFSSSDAHTIPEKHRQTTTYKKYVSPDNFIAALAHESVKPDAGDAHHSFVNHFNKAKSVYRPTSHSPPAVVSAHLPTHTNTAVNSATLERYFGEISISNGIGKFRRL